MHTDREVPTQSLGSLWTGNVGTLTDYSMRPMPLRVYAIPKAFPCANLVLDVSAGGGKLLPQAQKLDLVFLYVVDRGILCRESRASICKKNVYI